MAVAKQAQPQPSMVPVGIFVSSVAAVAASWFFAPGVAVLLLGLLITSFLARHPILTGPVDSTHRAPSVGNAGERQKMSRYQFWLGVRKQLLLPGKPWPLAFSHVAALGVALIAFTLPTTLVSEHAVWLNAAAGYLIVAQLTALRRQHASEHEPMPATLVLPFIAALKQDPALLSRTIIFGSFVVAGSVITWWWLFAADWYLIWPAPVAAAGVLLLGFAAVGHSLTWKSTRESWTQTQEAREIWRGRFASMTRVKSAPTLVSHRRVGAEGEGWIDVFSAPQGEKGSADWVPLPEWVRPTMPEGSRFSSASVPESNSDGQPILPSRSATQFQIFTWQGTEAPDINSPDIDPAVLEMWLHMHATEATVRENGAGYGLIPLGPPRPLHTPDSETAAWMVDYDIVDPGMNLEGSMAHLANGIQRAIGFDVQVIPFDTSIAYGILGADTTTFADPKLIERMEAEAEAAEWAEMWSDMTTLQAPTMFPQFSGKDSVLASTSQEEVVIHKRWFVNGNGLEVQQYFDKITNEKLRTALKSKPWAAMTHLIMDGSRYPGGIAVYWADHRLPRNPAEVRPGEKKSHRAGRSVVPARAQVSEGAKWLITGMINEGFTLSKLPIPEVLGVEPLTEGDGTHTHIWDIRLRLHGGNTVADVKRVRERIRMVLGSDWLRVTEDREGCRIVVGASPSHPRVEWRSEKAEMIATMLDWEQAFLDSGIKTAADQVPSLIQMSSLPKNELVKQIVFRTPAGVSLSDIRSKLDKLSGATNNLFLSATQGKAANEVVILAAVESPMPELAPFDWNEMRDSSAAPFATNIEGEPVAWNPLTSPHLVVLGMSGSGKSATIQALLTGAAIRGWELWVFDAGKFASDFQFVKPYCTGFATNVESIATGFEKIYAEVTRRKQLNVKHGTAKVADIEGPDRPPHLVVMIDELLAAVTIDQIPRITGDETQEQLRDIEEKRALNHAKGNIGALLGRIAREARSAGVSIIAGSQSLNKHETENTPGVFDVKKQAARMLLGKSDWPARAGAFKNPEAAPELGEFVPRGRGLMETAEGAPFVFQTWFGGDSHVEDMREQIAAVREPVPFTLGDDELTPEAREVTVFGERITSPVAAEPDENTVVREIAFDLEDLSFDLSDPDTQLPSEPEPEPEPQSTAEPDSEPTAAPAPPIVFHGAPRPSVPVSITF